MAGLLPSRNFLHLNSKILIVVADKLKFVFVFWLFLIWLISEVTSAVLFGNLIYIVSKADVVAAVLRRFRNRDLGLLFLIKQSLIVLRALLGGVFKMDVLGSNSLTQAFARIFDLLKIVYKSLRAVVSACAQLIELWLLWTISTDSPPD